MQRLLSDEINRDSSVIKVIGNMSAYGMGIWKSKEQKLKESFPVDFRKYVFSSRRRIMRLLQCPAKLNHIYFWIKDNPKLNRICDFTRNAWYVLHHQMNILPVVSLVRNNGFDGTGENCGYSNEEMNDWKNMKISEAAEYNVVDVVTKNDVKRATKKLFSDITPEEKKSITPVIMRHIIFGYYISQKIEILTDNMKMRIKKMIKK
jgi:glutaredoxin-related protein